MKTYQQSYPIEKSGVSVHHGSFYLTMQATRSNVPNKVFVKLLHDDFESVL